MDLNSIKKRLHGNEIRIISLSLGLGAVFGGIDSIIGSYLLDRGDLLNQIFMPDDYALWNLLFVMILSLTGSLIFIKMRRHSQETVNEVYESLEIFRNIFEYSAAGIALADIHGNFIRVNSSFAGITGYSKEELLRINFRRITHPEDLETDLSLLRKLQDNEIQNFSMEKRYLHKNGTYIWVILNVSPIRKASGEPLNYIAHIQPVSNRSESSFIDVSERNKAIFEKNRAYQELNQLFNTIGIGLCLIDREHTIARINDSFLKLFQKNRGDVIGHKCHEIMHESICLSDECPLNRILSGKASCEFESHKRLDEHTVLTFIITADPFISPDGMVQGIILSFTDITEIRMLEKSISDISEQERQNLGQLLHDELGQMMTGLSFRTEALKSIMEEKSYPEAQDAQEISSLLKKVNFHIRRIMIGLYPVILKYDRLLVALKDLAAETEKLFHMKCIVVTEGDVKITGYSEITQLLYIAKESVNNAIKHAHAKKIIITLSEKNNVFTMMIQNDVKIKENYGGNTNGLGLRIMRYRARLIGAKFEQLIEDGEFKVRVWKVPGING